MLRRPRIASILILVIYIAWFSSHDYIFICQYVTYDLCLYIIVLCISN